MVLWAETICGYDTDSLFAFTTQKVVWVRNRWIGGLYYLLVAGVVLWVFLVRILIRNDHFLHKDVQGVARMWYSHPTVGNCDAIQEGCQSEFKPLKVLPYCDVYRGDDALERKAHCEYHGKISMVPGGSSENVLFITTAVEVVTERRACNPSAINNYTCLNEYEALRGEDCLQNGGYLCQTRGGLPNQFYYVADAMDYKVQFTTTYERDSIRGTSLMSVGQVSICDSNKRAPANGTRNWDQRQKSEKTCKRRLENIPCESLSDNSSSCKELSSQGAFDTIASWFQRGDGEQQTQSLVQPAAGEVDGQEARLSGVRVKPEWPAPKPEWSATKPEWTVRPHQGRSLLQTSQTKISSVGERKEGPSTSSEKSQDKASGEVEYQWYSNQWGDVFRLSELLDLAGIDLDRDFNMDGWTAREAGMALEVSAVYHNLIPVLSSFGYRPVRYHYEVRELMMPYVSRYQLASVQPDDYPATRRYEVRYGVLIHFNVAGSFGFFNIAYFLLMLTTTFALTASARTITDMMALYVHPHRENFFHMKYEVSPDFGDCWKCHKCGFLNKPDDTHCKGLPRWHSADDTPLCGEPRLVGPADRSRGTENS
jgi:hypothetical protein